MTLNTVMAKDLRTLPIPAPNAKIQVHDVRKRAVWLKLETFLVSAKKHPSRKSWASFWIHLGWTTVWKWLRNIRTFRKHNYSNMKHVILDFGHFWQAWHAIWSRHFGGGGVTRSCQACQKSQNSKEYVCSLGKLVFYRYPNTSAHIFNSYYR